MASRALQCGFAAWLAIAGRAALLGAPGDSTPASPQSYQLKRWTSEDGLPQNRISCLEQTSDGYLWIGTWYGLTRFDGLHFTVFTKFDTPALMDRGSTSSLNARPRRAIRT